MINTAKLKVLKKAVEEVRDLLKSCSICPRKCGADRTKGSSGYCRAPLKPVVYSYLAHAGEEPALSGTKGSGAIFFAHCNMRCVYCQNYYFSQFDNGKEVEIDALAEMMLGLERKGCHNINLVSPTHFMPQIVMALEKAFGNGLDIPILYNTGGYELEDSIRMLDGVVDIYMPDMRYSDNGMAKKYSDAADYVEYNRSAVIEMQRQAGDLVLDNKGRAKKGLIIRLLVLPDDISGTKRTLRFIKENISENAYLSIMSQYYPTFKAFNYKEISRGVSREEYENIVDAARELGLNNGWIQEAPIGTEARFLGTNIRQKIEPE